MQLSAYHLYLPHSARPGTGILFSTRKGALCLIPEARYRELQEGIIAPHFAEPLRKTGLLVENRQAERRACLDYLEELNRHNRRLVIAVIPGMACNFACVYCYEGKQKGARVMGRETAARLIEFVAGRLGQGREKLVVDFYGGEPLLHVDLVSHLAAKLQKICRERGVAFSFNLVSNGSLLKRRTAEELVPLGLKSVKITLDGPPDIHDRSRPYKNGQGSFNTIFKNIKNCCELVSISLGGNFSHNNYHRFPELLDILLDHGITPDSLGQVQFASAMQVKDTVSATNFSGCAATSEPWLAEAAVYLRGEVKKRGFKSPKITPSPCAVDVDEAFTVHYNGDLYKCVALIGHEQFRIGNVATGISGEMKVYYPGHFKKEKKCRECAYLPLCFGGCRFMEYQRSGNMAKVDCMKEYYDRALPDMLMQEVKLGD